MLDPCWLRFTRVPSCQRKPPPVHDHANLRRHQPDPAHGDGPPAAEVARRPAVALVGTYRAVALPDPDPPHLASAAAVAEAAVIGLPHSALGEEVGLAVALKPGAAARPLPGSA